MVYYLYWLEVFEEFLMIWLELGLDFVVVVVSSYNGIF